MKHQITISIDVMRTAGLEAGERVARAESRRRFMPARPDDVHAGDQLHPLSTRCRALGFKANDHCNRLGLLAEILCFVFIS